MSLTQLKDKENKGKKSRFNFKKASAFMASLLMSAAVFANPELGNIESGNVTVTQSPNTETINQSSSQAIINWNSFNIGAKEHTHFQQPQGGVALNRISPLQGVSQIYGELTATGRIILVNPMGVYFGPSAHVNVGSIMVSTSGISNENFLAGRYIFDQPSSYHGSVINEGEIKTADYGLVALMGTSVVNHGVIEAHLGTVALGSGEKFTIDFTGDKVLNFSVDSAATSAGVDQNGQPLKHGVENTGSLIADGGQVLVTAKAAQHVLDNVVNFSGVAQARGVSQQGGVIILSGEGGSVHVSGKLIASNSYGKGGKVKVLGDHHVTLASSTNIDTSGTTGGGEILVGGNEHGAGPEMNALDTTVEQGALLNANALLSGDGGKVVVWSNDTTNFDGTISATGGSLGGNGGFVETSGHNVLNIGDNAFVNTMSSDGSMGTWLLDPADLTISSSSNSAVTSSSPFEPSGTGSILNVTTLTNALSSGNVIVETTSSGSGGNGDITVATPISWSGSNSLTLSAYRDLTINSNITNTAGANLVLQANNAGAFDVGSGHGLVTNNATLTLSGGGTVHVFYNPSAYTTPTSYSNAGTDTLTAYMLVSNVTDLQNMSTNLSGNYGLSKNIDASSVSFSPVGTTGTPYTGNFNGQGYLISGLTISASADNAGLFGVTSAAATIADVGVAGKITGGAHSNIGSLVGKNAGTITDTYSYASVNGTGSTNVGGLVGNNSGTINTSYAIGDVINGGGLVGTNTGTVNNSYYNSDTTSSTNAVGTSETTSTLQASLPSGFSSSIWGILSGTSYPYFLASNPSTPRVISGQVVTLSSVSATDPSVTPNSYANSSVTIPAWPPVSDSLGNATVTMAANGAVVDRTQTGKNGSYYFLEQNGALTDSTPLLTYLSSGGNATTITQAPASGASIKNLYLPINNLLIADNGDPANSVVGYNTDIASSSATGYLLNFVNAAVTPVSNTDFATAIGSLSDSNILYTMSGNDISVSSGKSFVTAPNTVYDLNGNLSTTNGNITFYGPIQESIVGSSYNQEVAITTNTSGNIVNNNTIVWGEGSSLSSPNTDQLDLVAANNIVINGPIFGMWLTGTGGTAAYDHLARGSLSLSAAFNDNTINPTVQASITTGPSGAISVYNFFLKQGNFWQVVPKQTTYAGGTVFSTLPYLTLEYVGGPSNDPNNLSTGSYNGPLYNFLSYNDFEINGGAMPSATAEFVRAEAATPTNLANAIGTSGNPFLIEDIYGLQGIGSTQYTLQGTGGVLPHYQLVQNLGEFTDAAAPGFWNGGLGLVPIGDGPTGTRGALQIGFSGSFNGEGYALVYLTISPTTDYAGLFGYTTSAATISNLPNFGPVVNGTGNYVGDLVGYNNGTISNVVLNDVFVQGNNDVGGLVGYNAGTIHDVANEAGVTIGNDSVGGIAGVNTGTIDKTLSVAYNIGNSNVGAIVGVNSGTIGHSFWDTDFSGSTTAVGSDTGTTDAQAGCFLGGSNCTNGGTVDLSSASPYETAGWAFSSSPQWAVLDGLTSYVNGNVFSTNLSYPYLPLATGFVAQSYDINGNTEFTSLDSFTTSVDVASGVPEIFAGQLTGAPASELAGLLIGASYSGYGPEPNFLTSAPFLNYQIAQSGANGFYYGYAQHNIALAGQVQTAQVLAGNASFTGTATFTQPDNEGSVTNLVLPVLSSGSGNFGFISFLVGRGNYSTGYINSLINSTTYLSNAATELSAYGSLYNYNLQLQPGALQQSILLSECNDVSSAACQKLLSQYGDTTPAGAIVKMLSDAAKTDQKINANNEFVPAACTK